MAYIGKLDVVSEVSADGDVFEVRYIVLENALDFLCHISFVLCFAHVFVG